MILRDRPRSIEWATDLDRLLGDLGVEVTGVLHIGAHVGQEIPYYLASGIERIVALEPVPFFMKRLRDDYGGMVETIQCAVGAVKGFKDIHLWGQMSSLLKPIDRTCRTEEVSVITLAHLEEWLYTHPDITPNMLVLDVQGAELEVLESGTLGIFDAVVVEVRNERGGHYEGQCDRDEVIDYLISMGFEPIVEYRHPQVSDIAFRRDSSRSVVGVL